MPFQSKKQSAACFATHGFGGAVNCKEWANKTNYKNIPKKKTDKIKSMGAASKLAHNSK